MNTVVWKFPLRFGVRPSIPRHAQILHVGQQDGQPMLWALCDPHSPPAERDILVVGTGYTLPTPTRLHIGTITGVEGGVVLHVFDEEMPF